MKTSYSERDYTFGQVMFTLRNKIGITQEQVGKTVGISGRAVSEWETGNSYPKAESLKAFIALAVQHRAFAEGSEASEIRALWKMAHQRMLLDEDWLSALLDQQSCPPGQAKPLQPCVEPEPVEVTGLDACQPQGQSHEVLLVAGTTDAEPALPDGSFLQTPLQTNADQPQRLPAVEARQLQGVSRSETPNPTMTEKFLRRGGGVRTEQDPYTPRPETNKTRGRRKWFLRILIALTILTIIGSAGTLFFQARENTSAGAYLSGKGRLAFFDPLTEASGSKWSTLSKSGWSIPGPKGGPCEFIGGTYHVIVGTGGGIPQCPASVAFSNFVFEVRLTIVQGDCGGMLFRDVGRHTYFFSICQNGLYNVFDNVYGRPGPLDQSSYSSAIHTGLGQQNTIAVEASGSNLMFYVNSQQIDQEQDSNPTSGGIGLIVDPHYHSPTDVAFSNARVWTL